jgi:hypothetical protein
VPSERLAPGALLEQTNLSGSVTDIDDDPDSPDGSWLTASDNNTDSVARVSLPSPTGDPTVGADLQEFRAQVRKVGGTGTPQARIELYENGSLVRAGTDGNVTGTTVIAFTWNANELATADGSLVECRVYGTKSGGSPSARATVEVGAIEWNVEYSEAGVIGSLSVTEQNDTSSASGEVAVAGSLAGTEDGDTTSSSGTVAVAGSTTVTEGDDTTSASGAVSITGSAALAESDDSVASAGTVGSESITGTLAAPEGSDAVSSGGDVTVDGTASLTENGDTASGAGAVAIDGQLASTEEGDTSSAVGGVLVDGTLAATEGGDTLSATGGTGDSVVGSLAVTEAADTASAGGVVSVAGQLSATDDEDAATSTGGVQVAGTLAATEGADTLAANDTSSPQVAPERSYRWSDIEQWPDAPQQTARSYAGWRKR